jgi:DNA-binding NarL/FixJ family response regulator
MRVVLADDLRAVRSALALLLEHEVDLAVVGQAADAAGLLQAVVRDTPDVIMMDWELPGAPASELVQTLRAIQPDLCIVALSSRPEAEVAAMLAGVDAFIYKGNPPTSVLETLDRLTPHDAE